MIIKRQTVSPSYFRRWTTSASCLIC